MKKRTFLPVTALLAMLALSACGGASTSNADTNVSQTPKTKMQATPTPTMHYDPCATATAKALATPRATGPAATETAHAAATVAATETAAATETERAMKPTGTARATATVSPATATAMACASAVAKPASEAEDSSSNVSARASTVKTASMTLNGKAMTVLTDARGMTLYYSKEDTAQKSACTAACTTTWRPLLAGEDKTVSSSAHLPGSLTVVKTAHGNQLAYNGHLLYTYSKDSAVGHAHGENVDGKWYVATTDLSMQH